MTFSKLQEILFKTEIMVTGEMAFFRISINFMNIFLAFISVKYAHDLIHVGLLLPIDLTAVI
jgi:hypothetical protein